MRLDDWKRADLHMHTSHSGWRSLHLIDPRDCYVPPEAAFDTARARGMDYVCFTDHNTIDGALELLSRRPHEEPRVIVGEEVEVTFPGSPQWLHINVLGVDEALHEDLQRLRADCFEMIAELTRRDLFFVLNHPFQSFHSIRAARRHLEDVLPLFPAVEVSNSTSPRCHEPILRSMLTCGGTRPCLAGSDAHTRQRIASAFTCAPGATREEFLGNLRRGACAVSSGTAGLPSLVRDVYVVVAEYYRRLYGGVDPLPLRRRLKNLFWSGLLAPGVVLGVPALVPSLHHLRQTWIARAGRWEPRPRLDSPLSLR